MRYIPDEYSSTLSRNRFLFFEMRIVAQLKLVGLTEPEIKQKVIAENLFQYKTSGGIRKSVNMALRRVGVLDPFLLGVLAEDSVTHAKVIAFYTILKTDRLLREFMAEVVREKILMRQKALDDLDFKIFFREKTDQSKELANWKPDTFRKLRLAYIEVLVEVGILNNGTELVISPLLMSPEFKKHLKQIGEEKYLALMLG